MKFKVSLISAAAVAVAASGCASLFSKSTYPVAVQSQPPGQSFEVRDTEGHTVARGVTPSTVELDAHRGFCKPARYDVQTAAASGTPVKAKVDPWVAANLFIGGLPGLMFDGMTGAMYRLPGEVMTQPGGVADAGAMPESGGVQQASHEQPVTR